MRMDDDNFIEWFQYTDQCVDTSWSSMNKNKTFLVTFHYAVPRKRSDEIRSYAKFLLKQTNKITN